MLIVWGSFKDTQSAIKNKLKKLITEFRGFTFVALVLVLTKIESEDKTKYDIKFTLKNRNNY